MFEIIGDHATTFEDHTVLDDEFRSRNISQDTSCGEKHDAISCSDVAYNDSFYDDRRCSYVCFDPARYTDVELICLERLAFEFSINLE